MRNRINLSRRVIGDNTCRDVGNEYKAEWLNSARDISVGQKIFQFKWEGKC
jgi:hypothetical protein